MKILVCSLTYPLPNGVTSSVNESIDGLLKAGHEIRIVAPEYEMGKIRPEHYPIPSSALGRTVIEYFGRKERVFGLKASSMIRDIVADFKPDLFWLHSVTWLPNAFERIMLESRPQLVR